MDNLDLGQTIRSYSPGQQVFSRYTLERILGRGGMGIVWLARDQRLDRNIALKFLPEIVSGDHESIEELKRESRRCLDLTHPNIVRIYDFNEEEDIAAISMEFIDGPTLATRKTETADRSLSPQELKEWVRQICIALDYAHCSARLVHRDIKPANLMIDAANNIKISDFGIAVTLSDSVSRVSNMSGSSGTPFYMSPQQMLGQRPAPADDLYSLGATLYELITSKPPFHTGNIIAQIERVTPPSMAERRAELERAPMEIPSEWEETIAACLAKEPSERPASAHELASRLGLEFTPANPAALAQSATSTPTRLTHKPRPTRTSQGPRLSIALLVITVLLAGAASYYFGYYMPEQKRRTEAYETALAQASELRRNGDPARALVEARRALDLLPEQPRAQALVNSIQEELNRHAEIERLLRNAKSMTQWTEEEQSLSALQTILELDPLHGEAKTLLQALHARQQQRNDLLQTAEKAVQQADSPASFESAAAAIAEAEKVAPGHDHLPVLRQTLTEQQRIYASQLQERQARARQLVQQALLPENEDRANGLIAEATALFPEYSGIAEARKTLADREAKRIAHRNVIEQATKLREQIQKTTTVQEATPLLASLEKLLHPYLEENDEQFRQLFNQSNEYLQTLRAKEAKIAHENKLRGQLNGPITLANAPTLRKAADELAQVAPNDPLPSKIRQATTLEYWMERAETASRQLSNSDDADRAFRTAIIHTVHARNGNPNLSLAKLEEVARKSNLNSPSESTLQRTIGEIMLKQKNFSGAMALLDKIKHDWSGRTYGRYLAEKLGPLGRREDAKRALLKAHELQEKYIRNSKDREEKTPFSRGNHYREMAVSAALAGLNTEAREYFQKSDRFYNSVSRDEAEHAWLYLASAYALAGWFSDAETVAQRIATGGYLTPMVAYGVWLNIADTHISKGNEAAANRTLATGRSSLIGAMSRFKNLDAGRINESLQKARWTAYCSYQVEQKNPAEAWSLYQKNNGTLLFNSSVFHEILDGFIQQNNLDQAVAMVREPKISFSSTPSVEDQVNTESIVAAARGKVAAALLVQRGLPAFEQFSANLTKPGEQYQIYIKVLDALTPLPE